jgi:hypothetical protein
MMFLNDLYDAPEVALWTAYDENNCGCFLFFDYLAEWHGRRRQAVVAEQSTTTRGEGSEGEQIVVDEKRVEVLILSSSWVLTERTQCIITALGQVHFSSHQKRTHDRAEI